MKTVTLAILLIIASTMASTMAADEPARGDFAKIVASHYPRALTADSKRHHYDEEREQAFASLEIGRMHYLVAAYTAGQIGAVVLMHQSSDNTYAVDQSIVGQRMQGTAPEMRAVDLDADGAPEIVVSYSLPRGADTSIFRIVDHRLELISPTSKQGSPELGYPAIVDMTGNGVMDLIEVSSPRSTGEDDEPPTVYDRYVLKHGKYVLATPLDYFHVFYRDRRPRNTVTEEFSIPKESIGKPFKLTIINGHESGKDFRVPRAVVTLNGVKISSSSEFSRDRTSWTIPVTLQENNTISVDLCATDDGNGQHSGEERGGGDPCGERGRIGIAIHHD